MNRRNSKRSPAVRIRNKRTGRKINTPVRVNNKSANCVVSGFPGTYKAFEVRTLPVDKFKIKGLNMLTSKRWISHQRFPTADVELPLIDRLGRYTGGVLYKCSLQPQSYISVVISTIFRRVKTRLLRTNHISEVNKRQNILLKCCAYYALTKNNYFFDRFTALSKNLADGWRTIKSILHRNVIKLDAHKWFVYGHVCLQTQWLTSRALRPRDKSNFTKDHPFIIPESIRGSESMIRRLEYDSIWSSFIRMHQV